jgi:probable rRNA maturation factor
MTVFVANEQDLPVDETRLGSLARHALAEEDVDPSCELSVLLVTSGHIRRLNSRFAGNDYATDVLAFPMSDGDDQDDPPLLGDVVICPEVAARNASKFGHGLPGEMDVLIVHGTLHLLGYDHQRDDDKARMDKRMRQILDSFRVGA